MGLPLYLGLVRLNRQIKQVPKLLETTNIFSYLLKNPKILLKKTLKLFPHCSKFIFPIYPI